MLQLQGTIDCFWQIDTLANIR